RRSSDLDDGGLGGAVVGLATVTGDASDGGHANDAAVVVEATVGDQALGDANRGDEVHGHDGVPACVVHVGEQLVAGDTSVVDDDVDALAEASLGVLLELVGSIRGGDVQRQGGALDAIGGLSQAIAGLRDVHADDLRAVASQDLGDGGTDAAGSTGD